MTNLDKNQIVFDASLIADLLFGTEILLNELPFTDAMGNRLRNLDAGVAGVRGARLLLEKLADTIDDGAGKSVNL